MAVSAQIRRDVGKDDVVDPEVDPVGLPRIIDRGIEDPDAEVGQEKAEAPTDESEDDALDQELTHDAPARGAEGGAHGDLARPRGRSREQKVGHVRAGDEQHEADRAHDDEEHDLRGATDVSLRECLDTHCRQRLVGIGIRGQKTPGDAVHLGLCFLAGRRVRQPSEDTKRARIPLVRLGWDGRRPHFGVVGESHADGHDADNRRRLSVDAHRRAEHVRIAAVPVLPEGVADNRDGFGAFAFVAGREITAEEWRLLQQAERIGRDPGAARLLRQRAVVADVHGAVSKRRKPRERVACLAPILQLEVRDRPPPLTALPGQGVEPIRASEGQAAEERRVDQREPDRVDADAQGERDDGGG